VTRRTCDPITGPLWRLTPLSARKTTAAILSQTPGRGVRRVRAGEIRRLGSSGRRKPVAFLRAHVGLGASGGAVTLQGQAPVLARIIRHRRTLHRHGWAPAGVPLRCMRRHDKRREGRAIRHHSPATPGGQSVAIVLPSAGPAGRIRGIEAERTGAEKQLEVKGVSQCTHAGTCF